MTEFVRLNAPARPIAIDYSAFDLAAHPILGSYQQACSGVSDRLDYMLAKDFYKLDQLLQVLKLQLSDNSVQRPQPMLTLKAVAAKQPAKAAGRLLNRISRRIAKTVDASERAKTEQSQQRLQMELLRWIAARHYDAAFDRNAGESELSAEARDLASALSYNGIACLNVPEAELQALKDLVGEDLAGLRAQQKKPGFGEYDRAVVYTQKSHPHIIAKVQNGIGAECCKAAALYRGRPEYRVGRVTLHLSRPGDLHLYQTYMETDYTPDLINLHFDPKQDIMKFMVYLGPVEEEDGAFCYIPGSHRNRYDLIQQLAAKAVGVTNYMQDDAQRRAYCKLPKRLRANNIIGALSDSAVPLQQWLLQHEVPMIGLGNVFLFDTNGLHRGGFSRGRGERVALQVQMYPYADGQPLIF